MPYEFKFPEMDDGNAEVGADKKFDLYQTIKQVFTGLDS